MTLVEIQEATGVPADHIVRELGLPPSVEHKERLGRLRTVHGFYGHKEIATLLDRCERTIRQHAVAVYRK